MLRGGVVSKIMTLQVSKNYIKNVLATNKVVIPLFYKNTCIDLLLVY